MVYQWRLLEAHAGNSGPRAAGRVAGARAQSGRSIEDTTSFSQQFLRLAGLRSSTEAANRSWDRVSVVPSRTSWRLGDAKPMPAELANVPGRLTCGCLSWGG